MFVELSEELAELRGIKNGERVSVSSPRGKVEAVAIVTKRWKPLKVAGLTIHEIGLPWCFGWLVSKRWRRECQSSYSDNRRCQHGNP